MQADRLEHEATFSIGDFVKAAIEIALYGSVDFDFGEELLEEQEEKQRLVHKA